MHIFYAKINKCKYYSYRKYNLIVILSCTTLKFSQRVKHIKQIYLSLNIVNYTPPQIQSFKNNVLHFLLKDVCTCALWLCIKYYYYYKHKKSKSLFIVLSLYLKMVLKFKTI